MDGQRRWTLQGCALPFVVSAARVLGQYCLPSRGGTSIIAWTARESAGWCHGQQAAIDDCGWLRSGESSWWPSGPDTSAPKVPHERQGALARSRRSCPPTGCQPRVPEGAIDCDLRDRVVPVSDDTGPEAVRPRRGGSCGPGFGPRFSKSFQNELALTWRVCYLPTPRKISREVTRPADDPSTDGAMSSRSGRETSLH